jgi:hypothetical protein
MRKTMQQLIRISTHLYTRHLIVGSGAHGTCATRPTILRTAATPKRQTMQTDYGGAKM